MKLITRLQQSIGQLRSSSLVMNSVYLMLATAVLSAFGFIFWIIVSRIAPPSSVGLATTLLSVSGLLSLLSLVGFDTTLVRFLPRSTQPGAYIATSITVVTIAGSVLSLLFVLLAPLFVPSLAPLLHHPWAAAAFIIFTVITALNTLTNAVLLAYKSAKDILIINCIFSAIKVALPLLFITAHPVVLFIMAGISQLVGLACSLIVIRKVTGHHLRLALHTPALNLVKKYSLSVYGASVLNLLPPTLLPLIILHYMGSDTSAYYYIAFTIASALYTIAYGSTQSAFAEGSHNEQAMHLYMRKAMRLTFTLVVPAMLLTIAGSGLLLAIFGEIYVRESRSLLILFAISTIPVAAYSACGALFKVSKNLPGIVGMNLAYAATIIGLSILYIPHLGLAGVGWAWLIGNVAACVTALQLGVKRKTGKEESDAIATATSGS